MTLALTEIPPGMEKLLREVVNYVEQTHRPETKIQHFFSSSSNFNNIRVEYGFGTGRESDFERRLSKLFWGGLDQGNLVSLWSQGPASGSI